MRPPPLLVAAAAAPALLVATAELLRESGLWDAGLSWRALVLVALLASIPPVLMLAAWRRVAGRAQGSPPELASAFHAIASADQAAARAAALLAQAEERFADASLARSPPTPRRRARSLALAGALALLLVVGGAAVAFSLAGHDAPPIHQHAAFAVFVNGTAIGYEDAAFDFAQRPYLRAHEHVGEGFPGVIHLEAAPGVTLAEFFERALDTRLAPDGIWLDAARHGGQGFRGNESDGLHVFVVHPGGEWMVAPGGPAYAPQDHDRILVSFGPLSVEEILREEAAVPVQFPS